MSILDYAADCLDRAWELRRDVLAVIVSNPDCRMPVLLAAFPDSSRANIAVIVRRLTHDGCIQKSGVAKRKMTYRALKNEIEPRGASRMALSQSGSKIAERNRASKLEMQRLADQLDDDALAAQFNPNGTVKRSYQAPQPWRTVNNPCHKPPIQNQCAGYRGTPSGIGSSLGINA